MGKPSRATQAKRNRERAKQEKREEKLAERAMRREQKRLEDANRPEGAEDVDPDLAGIVPGPQPPLEY